VLREKDVGGALAAAEQLAEYHAARAQRLEEATAAAGALLKLGGEFDAAARRLGLGAQARGGGSAGQVPAGARAEVNRRSGEPPDGPHR
jgi:hypothetical protein